MHGSLRKARAQPSLRGMADRSGKPSPEPTSRRDSVHTAGSRERESCVDVPFTLSAARYMAQNSTQNCRPAQFGPIYRASQRRPGNRNGRQAQLRHASCTYQFLTIGGGNGMDERQREPDFNPSPDEPSNPGTPDEYPERQEPDYEAALAVLA